MAHLPRHGAAQALASAGTGSSHADRRSPMVVDEDRIAHRDERPGAELHDV